MILTVQSSIFLTQFGSQLLLNIDVDRKMHRPTFKHVYDDIKNSFLEKFSLFGHIWDRNSLCQEFPQPSEYHPEKINKKYSKYEQNPNNTFENKLLLFMSLIFSKCGMIFFSVRFHDFVPFLLLTFPSSSLHPSVNNSLKIVTKGCNSLASVLFLLLFSLTPWLVRKLHSTLWGVRPRSVVTIFPFTSLALHSSQIDSPHL